MSRRHSQIALFALLIVGLLIFVLPGARAPQAILLDDGFTGTADGDVPTGWTEAGNGDTRARDLVIPPGGGPTAPPSGSTVPVASLEHAAATTATASFTSDAFSACSDGVGVCRLQFNLWIGYEDDDVGADYEGGIQIQMRNGGAWAAYVRFEGAATATKDIIMSYWADPGYGTFDTTQDAATNVWLDVEMRADFDAGTWRLTIDGNTMGEQAIDPAVNIDGVLFAGITKTSGVNAIQAIDDIFFDEQTAGGGGGTVLPRDPDLEEPELDIENTCRTDTKTLRFTDATVPLGSALLYIWDFGDGSRVVQSTNPSVEHTYLEDGTYTVDYAVALSDGTTYRAQFDATVGACVPILLSEVILQIPALLVAMGVALWLVFMFTRSRKIMILALIFTLVGASGWTLLLGF